MSQILLYKHLEIKHITHTACSQNFNAFNFIQIVYLISLTNASRKLTSMVRTLLAKTKNSQSFKH
jgi:hypothetical protein